MNVPPTTPTPPKKRRRWPKILAGVLGALVVLIVTTAFAAPFVAAPYVKSAIKEAIESNINGTAEIEGVSISWNGDATVHDVVLRSRSGEPVIESFKILAHVDLWKAVHKDYDVNLEVLGTKVHLRRESDGRTNIEHLLDVPPSPKGPRPKLKLDVYVADGRLDVVEDKSNSPLRFVANFNMDGFDRPATVGLNCTEDKETARISGGVNLESGAWDVSYELKNFELGHLEPAARLFTLVRALKGRLDGSGELVSPGSFRGEATAANLVIALQGDPMTFPTFKTSHHLDSDGKFELNIEAGAALKGHAKGVRKGEAIEGTVDVDSDLAELGESLRQILNIKEGMKVRGAMKAHADVAVGKTYDVKSKIELDRVVAVDAQGREVPVDPHVDVVFDGKIGADQVIVDRLNVTSQTVTATGHGAITGLAKGGTLSARDSQISVAADLDLLEQRLASFVDLGQTQLSGKVKFDGTVTGTADGFAVAGSGTALNFAVRWPDERGAVQSLGPLNLSLEADGAFVKADATINKFSVQSSATTMSVSGTLHDVTGDVKGELDYAGTIAPGEFTKTAGAWMKGVTMSGAPFGVSGHVGGRLKAPAVKTNATAKGLTVGWLEEGKPQSFGPFDLTLEGGESSGASQASAKNLILTSSIGTVQASGTVRDLTGDQKGEIDYAATVASDELMKYFGRFIKGFTLSGGTFESSGRLTGRLREPAGLVSGVAKGVTVGWVEDGAPRSFGPFNLKLETADPTPAGDIPVMRFVVSSDAGTVRTSATLRNVYGDVSGEVAFSGSLTPAAFTQAFAPWMKGVSISGGSVDFEGNSSGRLASPSAKFKVSAKDFVLNDGTRASGPLTFTLEATTRGKDFDSVSIESSAITGGVKGSMRDFSGKATIQPAEFSRAFKAYMDNQAIAGAPIEVAGRFAGDATNFSTRFKAAAGDLVVGDKPVKAFTLDADIVKKGDFYERLILKGPGLDVNGSGTATAMRLRADLEPAPLMEALGPFLGGTRLGGRAIHAELDVARGRMQSVRGFVTAAEFQGEGGLFGARKFSERDVRADVDLDYSDALIDVRRCVIKSANGSATAKGRIETVQTGRRGTLEVSADGDLATVLKSYLGRVTPPGGTEYAGGLSVRTHVVGDADVFAATGELVLSNLTVKRPAGSTVDPSFRVTHDATIDLKSKTVAIRRADVASAWMHGTVTGDVLAFDTTPTLRDFKFNLAYQPEAFDPLMELFLPGKFVGKEEQKLTGNLYGPPAGFDLIGIFNGTNGSMDIDLKSYQLQGVTMNGPLHGDVGGGHVVLRGTLAANGGTVSVVADGDLRAPPQCTGSAFTIKGEGIKLSKELGGVLAKMSPIFGGQGGSADGTMRMDFHGGWSAPLNSDEPALAVAKRCFTMSGPGITIPDLEVKNSPTLQSILEYLGDPKAGSRGEFYVTDLGAQGGAFHYSNMVLKLQGFALKFKGQVDFDGNLDLRMEAPITKALVEHNKQLAPFLADTMEVPIRGTVNDPKLDWGAAIGNAIKKAAEKTALNELQKILTPKKKKP